MAMSRRLYLPVGTGLLIVALLALMIVRPHPLVPTVASSTVGPAMAGANDRAAPRVALAVRSSEPPRIPLTDTPVAGFRLHDGLPGGDGEFILARARRDLQQNYGVVLDHLGLPPDRLARIKELLVERAIVPTDVQKVADESPETIAGAQKDAVIGRQYQVIDAEVKSLAGDPAYAEIATMISAGDSYREIRSTFVPDAAYYGIEVRPEQIVQLAALLANSTQPLDPDALARVNGEPADPATGLNAFQAEIYRKAGAILAPDQLKCFQQFLANRR